MTKKELLKILDNVRDDEDIVIKIDCYDSYGELDVAIVDKIEELIAPDCYCPYWTLKMND